MQLKPLPDVHYGEVGPVDTGAMPDLLDDRDDDEELAETPQDVIDLLGFDPLEDEDDGPGNGEDVAADSFFAMDEVDFKEEQHPRDKTGKFTKGAKGGKIIPHKSLTKELKAAGYQKAKGLTPGGHHKYTGPEGKNVYVGAAKPGQNWVTGWRPGGEGSFGSGAASLAKHLAGGSQSNGSNENGPPLNKVVTNYILTNTDAKFVGENADSTLYKGSKGSIKAYKGLNHVGQYAGEFFNINGQLVDSGTIAKVTNAYNSAPESEQPKSSLEVKLPPKAEVQNQSEEHNWYFPQKDSNGNYLNEPATTYQLSGDDYLIIGKDTGIFEGVIEGKAVQGKGQQELNAAFEALHPRGAGGKFISKVGDFEVPKIEGLDIGEGVLKGSGNTWFDVANGQYTLVVSPSNSKWLIWKGDKPGYYTSELEGYTNNSLKRGLEKLANKTFGQPIPLPEPKNAVLSPLDFSSTKNVGPQLGSNPGGQYEDQDGNKYYVKQPKTNDHAKNELLAASLYAAAGGNTLKYHEVKDGDKLYVGTDWQPLDANNMSQLTPQQKKEAQKDFALHAWLADWDAAGLTGDNVGVANGKVIPLDFGGSLLYRAQGSPKGSAFDNQANEWDTLRDPNKNASAAKLYGDMTPEQLKESAKLLDNIGMEKIGNLVAEHGPGTPQEKTALFEKLLVRKDAIQKKAASLVSPSTTHDVFVKGGKVPASLNGVSFDSYKPPSDWNDVTGVNHNINEPEFVAQSGKKKSAGLLMQEKDGRVWIVRPKNAFGGYEWTFPKGGLESGLDAQQTAIKESWEESGLKGKILSYAGDYAGDTSITRYYKAEREGGSPIDYEDETEAVALVPPEDLLKYLNKDRDRQIAKDHFKSPEVPHNPSTASSQPIQKSGTQQGQNKPKPVDSETLRKTIAEWNPPGKPTSAITDYKGSGYYPMNFIMRSMDLDEDNSYHANEIRDITKWLNKASSKEEVVLYRGIPNQGHGTYAQNMIDNAKEGRFTVEHGFSSVSAQKEFSRSWATNGNSTGVLFTLRVPKGTKMGTVRGSNEHDTEYEVLLQNGSRFKITNIIGHNNGVYEIEAEVDQSKLKD